MLGNWSMVVTSSQMRQMRPHRLLDNSPISMHRSIAQLRATQLLQASSLARTGSTTIAPKNTSPVRGSPLLTRIPWINRCPGPLVGCRQTGKRCFTNRIYLVNSSAETEAPF